MTNVHLQLVIPFHEPLCTGETELDLRCEQLYGPLIEALEGCTAQVSLHLTGHLLDHLSHRRSELLWRLKALVQSGRVEVLGGLFYGAAPALLPEIDVRGQIEMMTEYWESAAGVTPTGFWVHQLAWASELPRLFGESGLEYGFVGRSQVRAPGGAAVPLGVVERGGNRLGAFVLDTDLSSALPSKSVDAWMESVITAAAEQPLLSVWARAEVLAAADPIWLGEWLQALSSRAETVLPAQSFADLRPAGRLLLLPGAAAEIAGTGDKAPDWADFPLLHADVDVLYRRLLRTSDKLRETIDTMEENGTESEWSDSLATAQRMVFAAQVADAYWRGPGQSVDLALRDAVVERLIKAETLIDELVQGEDDWIAAEEQDRDGDLADEVFVGNHHLSAWLVPAAAGAVRSLDDRATGRNVLDAGRDRAGIRERLIKGGGPESLLADRGDASAEIEIARNEIDEEGDGTYHLAVRHRLEVDGSTAVVNKEVMIPIDGRQLSMLYRIEPGSDAQLVVEIPLRLGAAGLQVTVNGQPADCVVGEHTGVDRVRVEGGGAAVEISVEPAATLWLAPLRDGRQEQGILLAPIIVADTTIVLQLV